MRMIENAIGGHHLREILYRWKPSQREAIVNNIHANRRNATQNNDQHPDPASITAKELEAALTNMTDAELDAWIGMRSDGYTLPELDLEPGVAYHIPEGQAEAVTYQVKQQVNKGYMLEVNFEHDMWVSPGFGKYYNGREWPETSMRMYRILTDLRKLNAVLKKPRRWWDCWWAFGIAVFRDLEAPTGCTLE